MLTSAEARGIASALWGEVNGTERTNKRGAYWFNCAGHGGMIVSAEVIDMLGARAWVDKYVSRETAIRYVGSKKSTLMHPYRTRSSRLRWERKEQVDFYVFE